MYLLSLKNLKCSISMGKKNAFIELTKGCSHFTNFNTILLTAVDLRKAPGEVYVGPPKDNAKPNVTLTLEDEDMMDLGIGKLNPQKAFMSGKLKVTGNVMLTQKLQPLLRPQAKM